MKYFSIITVLIVVIVGWIANQNRKRKGTHDEVYERNSQKAKAYSWYATLAAMILFMWMSAFFDLSMSSFAMIIILFSVHVVTWGAILISLTFYTYT